MVKIAKGLLLALGVSALFGCATLDNWFGSSSSSDVEMVPAKAPTAERVKSYPLKSTERLSNDMPSPAASRASGYGATPYDSPALNNTPAPANPAAPAPKPLAAPSAAPAKSAGSAVYSGGNDGVGYQSPVEPDPAGE